VSCDNLKNNIMRKAITVSVFVLTLVLISSVLLNSKKDEQVKSMLELNVEALSDMESDSSHVPNFKSAEKWLVISINGEVSIRDTRPTVSLGATIKRIKCCFMATDMDACSFVHEDTECGQYIERPAH
jgi:hypothetical protein